MQYTSIKLKACEVRSFMTKIKTLSHLVKKLLVNIYRFCTFIYVIKKPEKFIDIYFIHFSFMLPLL